MKYLLLLLLAPLALFGATQGVSYNSVTRAVLQNDLDYTGDVAAFTTITKGAVTVPNINNGTWFSGGATETWTFNTTGTDPVLTFSSGVANLSTGTLQQGGTAVTLQSRALTIAGTPNEITSSAGSQSLAADRTWTLSLPTALTFTGKTVTGGTFSSPTLTTPTIASFVNATHTHQNAAGGGTLAEAALALTDVTTANATTSAHGFLKKLSNVSTEFMNGQGNWATPAGSGGSAPVGTMVNVGASTQYALPHYSDTTGTNMIPSLLTTDATLTNFYAGGFYINTLYVSNTVDFATNVTVGGSLTVTNGNILPAVNDGVSLGSSSKSFSDLFLASGGVVNFNNGNVTITHAAGSLTVAGATAVSLGTSAAFTTGTIELGHASANTLSATSGQLSVEGNSVFTAAITKADVLEASLFAADAGGTDAYAATLSPAITAYVTGAHYRFKANTANTGASTLNLNTLGAKTIKKAAGGITSDLADNDIRAGQWVDVVYDGTNMQMQSTLGNAAAGSGTVTSVGWTGGIVSVATATTTPAFTIAGTSGGIPYFASSSTWASSAALAANAIVIGGGAGAAPATTATGSGVVTALGVAANGAGGFVTDSGTVTMQNKTTASTWAGGNNTTTTRKYLPLLFTRVAVGTMMVNSNDFTAASYGRIRFPGNSTATNSNYAIYRAVVPIKFVGGSGQDLTMEKLTVKTSGTQTGAITFNVGMHAVADSAAADAADSTAFSNYVALTSGTLTSSAANDRFSVANKTLTTWRTSLTAGDDVEICLVRNDTNTDTMDVMDMLISYVETQ